MLGNSQHYISRELTHFAGRGLQPGEQYAIFLKILKSGWITHPPHAQGNIPTLNVNTKSKISANEMYLPQAICFCDIPIEDLNIHVSKYSQFGIAFDKDFIARSGGSPVHYVPQESMIPINVTLTPPEIELIRKEGKEPPPHIEIKMGKGAYFDKMMQVYFQLVSLLKDYLVQDHQIPESSENYLKLVELQQFLGFSIFSYVKFFNHNLADEDPNNYYFEREWRIVGNLRFCLDDIQRVFIPSGFAKRFRSDYPEYYGQIAFIG